MYVLKYSGASTVYSILFIKESMVKVTFCEGLLGGQWPIEVIFTINILIYVCSA